MNDAVYDMPISEVAAVLDKSDRQIRRYVKEKRLKAVPVRVDGHVKLMFNREEVLAYKEKLMSGDSQNRPHAEIIADTKLVEEANWTEVEEAKSNDAEVYDAAFDSTVKYVIDALREQIRELRKENQELHYQLEQRSGQVGFLQGKVEALQEELKMLMPPPQEEKARRKPWYKRLFGRS
jgi:predicted RNase H-like nuclease (RuvC/YqgF family)